MINFSAADLAPIFNQNARKYTSGESSSLSYAKTRQLLESIMYCLSDEALYAEYLTAGEVDIRLLYERGVEIKQYKIKKAKALYQLIVRGWQDYGNECCKETIINGFREFFKWYDLIYDAKNTLLTLDYPILGADTQAEGIERMYKYLSDFRIEQKFLKGFDKDAVTAVLKQSTPDSSADIINIAEVILTQALGVIMAGGTAGTLEIGSHAVRQLSAIGQDERNRSHNIDAAYEELMQQCYGNEELTYFYFKPVLRNLEVRYRQSASEQLIEHLFVIEKTAVQAYETEFIDGSRMDDAALRHVIEAIQQSRSKEERMELIRMYIRSLADLCEILEFIYDEATYEAVFQMLTPEMQAIFRSEIESKNDSKVPLLEWENYYQKTRM